MVTKNYKASLLVLFTALIAIVCALYYDYKVGYISYETLQYSTIMLVLGLAIGMFIQQIYSTNIFTWTKKSEKK